VEVTLAIKKDGKADGSQAAAYKIVEPIKDGHFRIQWPNTSSWPGCRWNYTLTVQAKEMVSGASSSSESSSL